MNSKFTLALIALVGVGVFALPSTMALFAGQHSFYNIDATGNQVPCDKCHGDVRSELASGYSATTNTSGPHAKFKCEYCHRAEAGSASGDDASAEISYKAVAPATGQIKLVTTVANFENGNFPKAIVYQTGMTVDNWESVSLAVQNLDGTQFHNQTGLNDYQGHYRGNLTPTAFATVGATYNYSGSNEVGLRPSGVPKDTNPTTQDAAFSPRNASFTANTTISYNGSGSREVTPGTQYHAASLVSCLECHGGEQAKGLAGYEVESAPPYNHESWILDPTDTTHSCNDCHYGSGILRERNLEAGGFGLTSAPNDTGATEAHNNFVRADGGVLRKGYGAANDACVGCHTHVAVDINFQKKYALKFTANALKSSPTDNNSWNVGGFSAQGTVDVEEYGNGTGGAFATGNHTYGNWAPGTTMYLVNSNGSQGAQVLGLNNDTSDNSSALTSP
jgi:hypothetical protein